MHARGDRTMFSDTLARGYALAFFVAIPASVGYAALAVPLAHAISFGRMNNAQGVSMVAGSIAALSVAVLAQTAFMIATYASYARTETRAPLRSMALQAVVCLVLLSLVVTQRGTGIPALIGGAFSLSVLIGAVHLTRGLARSVGAGSYRMAPSLLKVLAGSALMAGPAWLAASLLNRLVQGPVGALLAIAVGVAVGGGIFLRSQSLLRTPELGWLADGVTGVLGRKKAPAIGVGHV
jgi:putative peptidoglycan lipid II flippase